MTECFSSDHNRVMGKSLDKRELATIISIRTGSSRADVEAVLTAAIDVIAESMLAGDSVVFAGFGVFGSKEYPEQHFKKPRTGEPYSKPPRRVPSLKLFKSFLDKAKKVQT